MGKNVKTFLRDFVNSLIPQPEFYKKILDRRLSDSLKYFIALIFFVNLIFFLVTFVGIDFKAFTEMKNAVVKSLDQYPQDLKIYVTNGSLMTTYDKPYFLWFDYAGAKNLLLVVDKAATKEDLDKYGSVLLLTNDHLFLNRQKLHVDDDSVPLTHATFAIDKESVSMLSDIIRNYLSHILALVILIAVFVSPIFSAIYMFIIILIVSTLAYILYNLVDKKHNHKATLQLSLHASTVPILVFYGMSYVNPPVSNLTTSVFILILIFTLCALYEAYLDHGAQIVKKKIKK